MATSWMPLWSSWPFIPISSRCSGAPAPRIERTGNIFASSPDKQTAPPTLAGLFDGNEPARLAATAPAHSGGYDLGGLAGNIPCNQLLHQLEGGTGQRRTILRHRVDAHGNAVEQVMVIEGTQAHPRLHQPRLVEVAQHPFQ